MRAKRLYPEHIYDLVRRQIATELIQKELRKLLPSVAESQWRALDKDISAWFEGEKSELASVHDFWNGAEGVMLGFKLKNITRLITARNIEWKAEDISLEPIKLVWPVGTLVETGKGPYQASDISRRLRNSKDFKSKNKVISDQHAGMSVPRDHYPIIVLQTSDGGYTVLDGNRRVMRALIYEKNSIAAWVGRMYGESPNDFWVSSGLLRQLVQIADNGNAHGNAAAVAGVEETLKELFKSSEIARLNYELRVQDKSPLAAELYQRLINPS